MLRQVMTGGVGFNNVDESCKRSVFPQQSMAFQRGNVFLAGVGVIGL